MTRRRALMFGTRRTALTVGYLAVAVGSYALWEAYEKRGRSRPFVTKLLPGP